MPQKAVSVSQLNRYIGRVLSTDPILSSLCVSGEISGLKRHSSGHWYFDLKDEESRIRCFLHAARAACLRYEIGEGMEVLVFGSVNVYEPGGYYSINVIDIQLEGEGALAAAFEKLKAKLAAEGLFDTARKRPLPAFPKRIGVVTSPTGAAVRDIITTVKRRDPLVSILLYPASVQGEGSAHQVCEGIRVLNEKFPDLDLIIVGRGGGSVQDLWTFNEESVARAVFASKMPVISAVGHEVDTVITDLAADVRAATPTAAAELAVPHIESIKDRIEVCSPVSTFTLLKSRLSSARIRLASLKERADQAVIAMLSAASSKLALVKLDLDHSDPMKPLERGYIVARSADGKWKTRASQFRTGEEIQLMLADGTVRAAVTEVSNG